MGRKFWKAILSAFFCDWWNSGHFWGWFLSYLSISPPNHSFIYFPFTCVVHFSFIHSANIYWALCNMIWATSFLLFCQTCSYLKTVRFSVTLFYFFTAFVTTWNHNICFPIVSFPFSKCKLGEKKKFYALFNVEFPRSRVLPGITISSNAVENK